MSWTRYLQELELAFPSMCRLRAGSTTVRILEATTLVTRLQPSLTSKSILRESFIRINSLTLSLTHFLSAHSLSPFNHCLKFFNSLTFFLSFTFFSQSFSSLTHSSHLKPKPHTSPIAKSGQSPLPLPANALKMSVNSDGRSKKKDDFATAISRITELGELANSAYQNAGHRDAMTLVRSSVTLNPDW
jgi:hypothetical protein